MGALNTNDIIQQALFEKCENLEKELGGNVIFIRAPMASGIDDVVRRAVEGLVSHEGKRDKLIVVLETNGGSIEAVERISDVFRHHFEVVEFVVPSQAYSAGTVLVLSGDAIYMDYYSVLGPIDPQIKSADGRWVPGLGYLEKYNELIEKGSDINVAEMEYLLQKFDPAELFSLEQARKHSVALIEKWLSEFKFKNWKKKEGSGKRVTNKDRKERAQEIARLLGDPNEWHSHGRGIGLKTLESDKIKLKIDNFGEAEDLNRAIREYYDLIMDCCRSFDIKMCLHTKNGLSPL